MDKLKNILTNYISNTKTNVFFEDSFNFNNTSFKKIGEILTSVGTIIEEVANENIYIVSVKILFNCATVAIELKDEKINLVACAREVLIKQHTAKRAVEKIKKVFLYALFK